MTDPRSMDELLALPDGELGAIVADAADEAFPPTPEVASLVRARMEREEMAYPELRPRPVPPEAEAVPEPSHRWRRAIAVALLIVLIVALVAAVTIGPPGLRIHLG